MIVQNSCSELLVDTSIHNAQDAFDRFSKVFADAGWSSSPPISVEVLEELKGNATKTYGNDDDGEDWYGDPEIMVFDEEGNRAFLQYGENGYITTGFRFDSNCSDGDTLCYPIFKVAIEKLGGELISCDGGHTGGYEEWESGGVEDESY